MSYWLVAKIAILVGASIPITWVSARSLRHRGSHGYYRFFAWEAIALLFVLNVDRWFHEPFSPRQIVSWVFLFVGTYLVLDAVRLLRQVGRPKAVAGHHEYQFEQTTELVVVGLYRWIRHPMYSSLLFLAWAVFLKHPSLEATLVVLVATVLLSATARADEREDVAKFGEAYLDYMKATKRFVPLLW